MNYIFDFSKDHILEDDCVLLRPLNANDCVNLRNFSQNEPEIWQYSLQKAAGEKNLQEYIQMALMGRENKKEYPFIVFDKRARQYAGSTRLYDINLPYRTLLLGYTWYGRAFQGTGLNKHCKFLLLRFAFEELGMERVEFRADNSNMRSIAAMKGIGCKVEGVLRSHMPNAEGGRRDSIVLSIVREEWFHEVKEHLQRRLI
jgi:RimJ/RimL family protein N-acetyltransferase